MSILVAYKKGDTVFMGTDTRVCRDGVVKNELCKSNHKIQKVESGILVGVSGDLHVRQNIFAYSEIFTLNKRGELTRAHIVKEIIPKLIEMLDGEELLVKEKDTFAYMPCCILIAYKDKLYEICSSFMVIAYEDFQAVGSKTKITSFAQATLFNTKDGDDVKQRIIKALEVVSKHTISVGAPYLLIDTKDQRYKLVGGNV